MSWLLFGASLGMLFAVPVGGMPSSGPGEGTYILAVTESLPDTPEHTMPTVCQGQLNGNARITDYIEDVGQSSFFPCPVLTAERNTRIQNYIDSVAIHFAALNRNDVRRSGNVRDDSESSLWVTDVFDGALGVMYDAIYDLGVSPWLNIKARNTLGCEFSLQFSPLDTLKTFSGTIPGEPSRVKARYSGGHIVLLLSEVGVGNACWTVWYHFDAAGNLRSASLQTACTKIPDCEGDKWNLDTPDDRYRWFACTESRFARDATLSPTEIDSRLAVLRRYVNEGEGDINAFRALVARDSVEAARNGLAPIDIKQDLLRLALPGEPLVIYKDMVISKLFDLYGDVLTPEELRTIRDTWRDDRRVTAFLATYNDQNRRMLTSGWQGRSAPK